MLRSDTVESAERSVLGLLMLDGRAAQAQCVQLRTEHFSLSSHREIFDAILRVMERQEDCGMLLVGAELGKRLDSVGNYPYLHTLMDGMYRGFDPQPRIDLIIEAWKTRKGLAICEQYQARFNDSLDATETLSAMQQEVFDAIADDATMDDPAVCAYSDDVFERLMEGCNSSREEMGASYGLEKMDSRTGGMRPGDVTVVGADSGGGKTALLRQAVMANCIAGRHCTVFSLEMTREKLLHGFYAAMSGVEYRKIFRPYLLTIEDRARLKTAYLTVKQWPLAIYDNPLLHVNQMVAFARLQRRHNGTQLVALDYAQIAVADGRDEKERVSKVSRSFTAAAKSEGFHAMVLSQFRKAGTGAGSHKPTADDLAETRQLKNDASTIVLIHRQWDNDNGKYLDECSLIFPKVRHGEAGTIPTIFRKDTLTFEVTQ